MIKIIFLIVFLTFQSGNSQITSEPTIQQEDNNVYNTSNIEVIPNYPGGIKEFYKYIGEKYKVPNVQGLSGKVFMSFVVEKNGKLTDIKVVRDIGYGSGKEAIRVLKKCKKWTPGSQNGKEVRVQYSLPINIVSN